MIAVVIAYSHPVIKPESIGKTQVRWKLRVVKRWGCAPGLNLSVLRVIHDIMDFGYKIWLEKDGQNVFGMGIYRLLRLVDETGSLHKAALNLKMSYRAAWGKVRDYEERLGVGLLEKGRHGRTGAHLTPEAKVMLTEFKEIIQHLDSVMASEKISSLLTHLEGIEERTP